MIVTDLSDDDPNIFKDPDIEFAKNCNAVIIAQLYYISQGSCLQLIPDERLLCLV